MFGSRRFLGNNSRIGLVGILIALCSSVMAAPREGSLAVLGVWLDERLDSRLAADVARRLRQSGEEVQPGRGRSKGDWSCADLACLSKTAEEIGTDRLLQVAIQEVDHDSQNYLISIRLFDSATRRIEERQTNCDGCNSNDRRVEQVAIFTSKLIATLDKSSAVGSPEKPVKAELLTPINDDVNASASTESPNLYYTQPLRALADIGSEQSTNRTQSEKKTGTAQNSPASYFLGGFSLASGLTAIGVSILATTDPCPTVADELGNVTKIATSNTIIRCRESWLAGSVTAWSVTALSSTVAVTLRYLRTRKR